MLKILVLQNKPNWFSQTSNPTNSRTFPSPVLRTSLFSVHLILSVIAGHYQIVSFLVDAGANRPALWNLVVSIVFSQDLFLTVPGLVSHMLPLRQIYVHICTYLFWLFNSRNITTPIPPLYILVVVHSSCSYDSNKQCI